MSRIKASITQRDWSFGEIREDFLERDDTDLTGSSAREILNMRILASGSLTTRPGSVHVTDVPDANRITETRPSNGEDRLVVLIDGGITIIRPDGSVQAVILGLPWDEADTETMWIKPYGDQVLLGSRSIMPHVLDLKDLTVSPFKFLTDENGATEQPYYNFHPGVTIQPDRSDGLVTIRASEDVFTPDYVGTTIRYNEAEILITAYISPQYVQGNFLQETPETVRVTLDNITYFEINDAVEGADSAATGIVKKAVLNSTETDPLTGDLIDTSGYMFIIMDDQFVSFNNGEGLIGPNTPVDNPPVITSIEVSAPAPTENWSEPAISNFRGWPGYAEFHQNRLVFVDIPSIPSAIIMSAAGNYNSFKIGSADGDAIFETYEDRISNRHLYAISAEDLVIFSSESVSYIGTRGLEPITPANIAIRRFSTFGAAEIEPIMIDDGIAYVSKGGNRIIGAVLSGDANRYWAAVHLSEYAPHLINGPVRLGSTEGDSDRSERYLFVINGDGSLAVMRWQKAPFQERMGWFLWKTRGSFIDMSSVFGSIHGIVERNGIRKLERFEEGIYLDGAIVGPSIAQIEGTSVWAKNRYLGTWETQNLYDLCYPEGYGPFQTGYPFEQRASLWPRELENTNRKGFVRQRNGRVSVSVQNSTSYLYNGRRRPHYNAGEDLSAPPVDRTEVHRFATLGRFDHPVHIINKPEPGPLTVLAFNVEVQG